VVIGRAVADHGHLRVGDRTTALVPERVPVPVVGIVTFGANDLGRSAFIGFTLAGAERHIAKGRHQMTNVAVRAAPGMSQRALAGRIAAVLPHGVEAVTGGDLADESISAVNKAFVTLLRTFLLVFAGVALLVAAFTIANTFSIIVAQRGRESALLRALGASRRQVLASVLIEASAIGLPASIAGLGGGLAVAAGLKAAFAGIGIGLPAQGLVVTAATVAVAVPTGVVVTLAACLLSAVRASRVPPLVALRDLAVELPATSRARTVAGCMTAAVGAGLVLWAAPATRLPAAGIGAACTVIGVILLGPALARPASAILGAPLARARGVSGALARRNAARSPRRTAGAATALMIGVGVVMLFTVFAASLRTSIEHSIGASFGGDLAIQAGGPGTGFDPGLARQLGRLPEVAAAAGMGEGDVLIDGVGSTVKVSEPGDLTRVLHLETTAGSLAGLGAARIAVSTTAAGARGWRVGSPVRMTYADGTVTPLAIGAIYRPSEVVGDYLMPRRVWSPHESLDSDVFVELRAGVGPSAGRTAVERVARAYGAPRVQDRRQYIDTQAKDVTQLLGVVYVMLALAILIALLGIANTLSLAVYERTRELGLLRAVGATRGQLRSMIRWESVIVALFGTVGGVTLGVFLGWALVRASAEQDTSTFTAPVAQLLFIVAGGGFAGVIASVRPARRAARLGILDAIAAP
jgi:putative ABC transport system permease protein